MKQILLKTSFSRFGHQTMFTALTNNNLNMKKTFYVEVIMFKGCEHGQMTETIHF